MTLGFSWYPPRTQEVLAACLLGSQTNRRERGWRGTSTPSAADSHWWFAGTSSIDTTCTIWGLETGQVLGRVNLVSGHVKTQLIAHDKEVLMLFCRCFLCLSVRSGRCLPFLQVTWKITI